MDIVFFLGMNDNQKHGSFLGLVIWSKAQFCGQFLAALKQPLTPPRWCWCHGLKLIGPMSMLLAKTFSWAWPYQAMQEASFWMFHSVAVKRISPAWDVLQNKYFPLGLSQKLFITWVMSSQVSLYLKIWLANATHRCSTEWKKTSKINTAI